MRIKNFKDLEIWREAKKLAVDIFRITTDNKFRLDLSFKDQIRRSAVSIASNIAEGFERDSNNKLIHYLRISKGSCAELITQIEIAQETSFLAPATSRLIIKKLEVLSSKVGRFISYLLTRRTSQLVTR